MATGSHGRVMHHLGEAMRHARAMDGEGRKRKAELKPEMRREDRKEDAKRKAAKK